MSYVSTLSLRVSMKSFRRTINHMGKRRFYDGFNLVALPIGMRELPS